MKVVLPYNVVKDRVDKFLKHFVDDSGVVKALKKALDEFPTGNLVKFLYSDSDASIIYGASVITVEGERNVKKLLRWVFYEEKESKAETR